MLVTHISKKPHVGLVYNLGTSTQHNYFVASNIHNSAVLVHNCYKSNTKTGVNMSFDTFKQLFSKFPKHLTQIAFGIGDIDGNPDLWNIMEYCRQNNVIPNITINGERMTPRYYDLLSNLCGAVAVSLYNYDICYNSIAQLTSRGMKQINIHCLAANENYDTCVKVIQDIKTDIRLKDMNAVVFLALKPKGNRNNLTKLSKEQFKNIVNSAMIEKINFGFDSCTAHNFLDIISDNEHIDKIKLLCEPCESTCFSYYISADGKGYPCSFCEGQSGYVGVDVLNCNDFIKDVWFNPETVNFRNKNINNKHSCVEYDLSLG